MKDSESKRNTEKNALDLFKAAQKNIVAISNQIESNRFPLETKSDFICRFAAESVEDMLKGWMRDCNEELFIPTIHNLDKLHKMANNVNNEFESIKESCLSLDNYTPELRYSSPFKIEEHEIQESLKNLKSVYDFDLIKETRDKINSIYQFNVLPDDISELFGKFRSKDINNSKTGTGSCDNDNNDDK